MLRSLLNLLYPNLCASCQEVLLKNENAICFNCQVDLPRSLYYQDNENPLVKLDKINGYTFDWIPTKDVHSNVGRDVGVIAQEIEEVLPELVGTRSDGFKGVKYEKLTALLIQANKELIERVEELESKLKK